MSKILYIDHISPDGHINFNKIYLDALMRQKYQVDIVCKAGYFKKIKTSNSHFKLEIPNILYRYKDGITNRILFFLQLIYIKHKIDFSNYDYILLSSYEEISLFFAKYKYKLFIVNHDNIRGLDSRIKRFFIKKISQKNTHIVFEQYIKEHLKMYRINNVCVISHGLINPLNIKNVNFNSLHNICPDLHNAPLYNYVIFSPSASSTDYKFIRSLLSDESFGKFLMKNKIIFIAKGHFSKSNNKNIVIINNYLSQQQYESLFSISNLILICYPSSFKYRVSGILMECISNEKICFIKDIEALKIYSKCFTYNPYFKNKEELINLISLFIKDIEYFKIEKDCKNLFIPDFSKIFI